MRLIMYTLPSDEKFNTMNLPNLTLETGSGTFVGRLRDGGRVY